MRVLTPEETKEELSRGKPSEDGQVASYASSVTLCALSTATEAVTPEGERLTTIENMLASQQDILHRLLSASETLSPLTPVPEVCEPTTAQIIEERCEPCTSRTSEDIYERARMEAGFADHHEWNAAYIHGMVHIDGKKSSSATKTPACDPCAEAHRFAVCVNLEEGDPYRELLHNEKKICCGWCEYEKISGQEHVQQERVGSKATHSQHANDDRAGEQQHAHPSDGDSELREKPLARLSEFFIDGIGLDREVVEAEIPLFLGTDSVVRPGTHYDDKTSTVSMGYYITAHRPPTSAMLADLRADSAAWQMERENDRLKNSARKLGEPYLGKQPARYHTYCFQFSCPKEQAPE